MGSTLIIRPPKVNRPFASRCHPLYWGHRIRPNGYPAMCLAIPMQIVEIDGFNARCTAKGVSREVSLFLMQDEPLAVGDFVMVHTGHAHQKISAEDERLAWALYDEMLAAGEQHG